MRQPDFPLQVDYSIDSYSVDSLTADSFAIPKAYRPPSWQISPTDQPSLGWLGGSAWGLNAIDAIADPAQGVSETWWRVFKEHQTHWTATMGLA